MIPYHDFLEANYFQISRQNVYTGFFSQELIISWCSNKARIWLYNPLYFKSSNRICSKIIRCKYLTFTNSILYFLFVLGPLFLLFTVFVFWRPLLLVNPRTKTKTNKKSLKKYLSLIRFGHILILLPMLEEIWLKLHQNLVLVVKLIFSKKATKIDKIFNVDLTFTT